MAVEGGPLQPSLFDTRDMAEIDSPDYPGERLLVCKNPLLGQERARKRSELYQPPYPVTGLAQVRLVREAMRSGISISLFQAFWQASRMDS